MMQSLSADEKIRFGHLLKDALFLATSIANLVQTIQPLIEQLQHRAPQRRVKSSKHKICACRPESEIPAEVPEFLKALSAAQGDDIKGTITGPEDKSNEAKPEEGGEGEHSEVTDAKDDDKKQEAIVEVINDDPSKSPVAIKITEPASQSSVPTTVKVISRVKFNPQTKTLSTLN